MHKLRHRFAVPVVASALALAASWASLEWTDAVIWHHRGDDGASYLAVRMLLLAVAVAAAIAAALHGVAGARLPLGCRRALVAACACFASVLLLEIAFTFVARSHGVGYTLAGRVWHERHWSPINALGYRDAAGTPAPGQRVVWLLGDSFTSGHGLADVAQRFGDQLAALRPDLHVVNLGQSGADTAEELRRLRAYPGRPDLLVLQHFVNDFDGAAERVGRAIPSFAPYQDLQSTRLRFLVRGSYLANFLYWQFAHGDAEAYERFARSAIADEAVARLHETDLAAVHEWAVAHDVPLYVLLVPRLEDPERSRPADERVRRFFADRGVPTIDAARCLADLPVAARVVNAHDAHASALANERIARELAHTLAH